MGRPRDRRDARGTRGVRVTAAPARTRDATGPGWPRPSPALRTLGPLCVAAPAETRGTNRLELDGTELADWVGAMVMAMQPLRARVRKGRIVLDEPTDLPDGDVELLPADEVLARGGDYLDDEERERLHAAIDRGLEDVKAGRTVDADEVIKKLRARAASR